MDITKFFESIDIVKMCAFFNNSDTLLKEINVSEKDLKYIYNIVLYKNHLVIGSVSSPIISNIIMYNFDMELRGLLSDRIMYTRYADDMIFSSQEFLDPSIVNVVTQCVQKYEFNVNNKKTYFMSQKGRRMITGLIIDRGEISIGLQRKKEIKSMLYKKLKHNKGEGRKILGYLHFLKDIEPDYFNKLINKYSNFGNVLELLKKDSQVINQSDHLLEVAITRDD